MPCSTELLVRLGVVAAAAAATAAAAAVLLYVRNLLYQFLSFFSSKHDVVAISNVL